jgi:hypothetical protein
VYGEIAEDWTMTKVILTIDLVSDVFCPWCYIGKRRRPTEELAVWNGMCKT